MKKDGTARVIVAATALVLLLGAPKAASGATSRPPAVHVTSDDCADLRTEEVERVVSIELSTVSAEWTATEPLGVELSCEGLALRVVAVDPLTGKRLSREVSLQNLRDRERTIALVVSQLFLTSWSEMLLRPPPSLELPIPLPSPAVRRAAVDLVEQSRAGGSRRTTIAALGGPRVRDGGSLLGWRAAIRPAMTFNQRWEVSLELGYERGAVDRASGAVGYALASGTVGIGLRSNALGPFVFVGAVRGGIAYADLHGDASAPAVGSSASGAVMEAELGGGPVLHLGPSFVGLELTTGVTAPRATAHVARDVDVAVGGVWFGASLVLGMSERP